MVLHDIINQFSEYLGTDTLEPDERGRYQVTFDDVLTVDLIPNGPREVILKGDVCQVSDDETKVEEQLKEKLRLNTAKLRHADEVLCMDPENRMLVIYRKISLMGISMDLFYDHVEAFVNALEFWKEQKEHTPRAVPPFPGMFP